MDTIAFLIGPYSIYWSTIMLALAGAVGVLLFWCFYLWDGSDRAGAFLLPPLALVLGILGGRMAHWYFRADTYESFLSAMTDYSVGGFALVGTFLGVLLVFTLRYCKTGGWKPGILCFWGSTLLLLSTAGYMEYYVQRHSGEAAFAYSLMSAAMALVLALGTALWVITRKREIPRSLPTIYPKAD